jgi:DNA-binding response OmpR family regulator
MQGDREKCLEAGMDDYLSKPMRMPDLQEALGRCAPANDGTKGRSREALETDSTAARAADQH